MVDLRNKESMEVIMRGVYLSISQLSKIKDKNRPVNSLFVNEHSVGSNVTKKFLSKVVNLVLTILLILNPLLHAHKLTVLSQNR